MDFSGRQQEPGKKFFGLGLVIVFHIILGWALMNGLGSKVAAFIQKPMEAVVKETPPPPPPPPEEVAGSGIVILGGLIPATVALIF